MGNMSPIFKSIIGKMSDVSSNVQEQNQVPAKMSPLMSSIVSKFKSVSDSSTTSQEPASMNPIFKSIFANWKKVAGENTTTPSTSTQAQSTNEQSSTLGGTPTDIGGSILGKRRENLKRFLGA